MSTSTGYHRKKEKTTFTMTKQSGRSDGIIIVDCVIDSNKSLDNGQLLKVKKEKKNGRF